jgi:chromosome partitioning protein
MSNRLSIVADAAAFENWFAQPARPSIIVFGNEKGGSGKSTTAMHMIVGLLKRGHRVGSIDLDSRQASLTHYVQNRIQHAAEHANGLELPDHRRLNTPARLESNDNRTKAMRGFASAIEEMRDHDYIVIDTPGAETFLSHLGHVVADTLITPLNDSFFDLDVLIRLDAGGQKILGASAYAHTVLARAERRKELGGPPTNWIVMQTRRAHLESRNRRQLDYLLKELSKRIGFRLVPGLSERVVYRELFTQGLTVLDIDDHADSKQRMQGSSRRAAREEVNALIDLIPEPAPMTWPSQPRPSQQTPQAPSAGISDAVHIEDDTAIPG